MSTMRAMNCGVEAVCILISVILLIQLALRKRKRETDRWYACGLVANIGMMFGDLSDWVYSGVMTDLARSLIIAGSTVYFIASGILMACYLAYIYLYIRKRQVELQKWPLYISMGYMVVHTILALLSPMFGLIFYVSRENRYERGPLFFLSTLNGIIVFALCFYLIILGWKKLNAREKCYFVMYLAFPVVAETVQVTHYGVAVLNVAITITFLLIISLIQSETDDQLKAVEEEFTNQIIVALSNAVEAKDRYTNGHSRRVAEYSVEIARRLGFDGEEQRKVYYAGLLHDVGKIRVLDSIINKTGKLNTDEYESMKLHTLAGYYILKEISAISDFAVGARWHHERYDGHGYPNGLSKENIPLIARIIGVADTYDAMTSNRSYRSVMPQEKVREEILKGSGTQFDPRIAEIMLEIIDEDKEYKLRQMRLERKRRILAIDDNSMVLKQLRYILETEEDDMYDVTTVSSGEEGMERLWNEEYDLVLLDVEMEGKSGFQVLQEIRERKPKQPVIFMTGDKEMEMIVRAEQMQISDYLTKPLVPHQLKESISNVLRNVTE